MGPTEFCEILYLFTHSIVAKRGNIAKISNITFCENTQNCLGLSIKSFTKKSELKGESEKRSEMQSQNFL
jgi:hypothetical protein